MDRIYKQIYALCDRVAKSDDVDDGDLAQIVIAFTYSILSHIANRPVSLELRVSAGIKSRSGFIFGVQSIADETLDDLEHIRNSLKLVKSNSSKEGQDALCEFQKFVKKLGNISDEDLYHDDRAKVDLDSSLILDGKIKCEMSPVVVIEPLPKEFLHNYSKTPGGSVTTRRSVVSSKTGTPQTTQTPKSRSSASGQTIQILATGSPASAASRTSTKTQATNVNRTKLGVISNHPIVNIEGNVKKEKHNEVQSPPKPEPNEQVGENVASSVDENDKGEQSGEIHTVVLTEEDKKLLGLSEDMDVQTDGVVQEIELDSSDYGQASTRVIVPVSLPDTHEKRYQPLPLQHRCPLCKGEVVGQEADIDQLKMFLCHLKEQHGAFSEEFASSHVDEDDVVRLNTMKSGSPQAGQPFVTVSDIFTCLYCHIESNEGKVFGKKANLRRHIEESHMTKNRQGSQLTCPCCDKSFGTLGGDPKNAVYRMSIHMEESHGLTLNIRPVPNLALTKRVRKGDIKSESSTKQATSGPLPFPCTYCRLYSDVDTKFADSFALRRHIQSKHTTEVNGAHRLACPICPVIYETFVCKPRSLVTRMCEHLKKVHTDHAVVNEFVRASEAESGESSEVTEKQSEPAMVFKCVVCEQKGQRLVFWTNTSLRRHIQSDHMVTTAKDQSIKCPFCNRLLVSHTMKPRTLVFRLCKHMKDIHGAASQMKALSSDTMNTTGDEGESFQMDTGDSLAEAATDSSTYYCVGCICADSNKGEVLHDPFPSAEDLVIHTKETHVIEKDGNLTIDCAMCQKQITLRTENDIVKRYLKHLTTVHAFQYWNSLKATQLANSWGTNAGWDEDAETASESRETVTVSRLCEATAVLDTVGAVPQDEAVQATPSEQTEDISDGFADAVLVKLGLIDVPGTYRCYICSDGAATYANITNVTEHILQDHLLCSENSTVLKCATCSWSGKHGVKRQLVASFIRHCVFCHSWLNISVQGNSAANNESGCDKVVEGLYENIQAANTKEIVGSSDDKSLEISSQSAASYTCFLCVGAPSISPYWGALLDHLRDFHVREEGLDSALLCSLCDFRIPRRASLFDSPGPPMLLIQMLTAHMVTKHRRPVPSYANIHRCTVCGWEDMAQSEYVQHMRAQHNLTVKPIVTTEGGGTACAFCGKSMQLNAIHAHIPYCPALIRKQDRALQHKCSECLKSFTRKNILEQHIRNVHQGEKNALCPTCGETFFARRRLRVHAWEEHGENISNSSTVLCPECGETFPDFYMGRHQLKTHPKSDATLYSDEYVKRRRFVRCEICAKRVASRDINSLARHKARVHNIGKFQCHICNAIMLSEEKLRTHQRISHTKETLRHYCVLCRKQFMSRNNYHFHMFARHEVNLSRKPVLTCGECGYKTIGKHFMREHEATHIGRSFLCVLCPSSFPSKARLNGHINRVHSNRKYKCNHCAFKTLSRPSLLKHVNRMHLKRHFRCKNCKYTTHVERYYNNHLSLHHGVSTKVANAVLTNLWQQDKDQLLKGTVTDLTTQLTGKDTDVETHEEVINADITPILSLTPVLQSSKDGDLEVTPGEVVTSVVVSSPEQQQHTELLITSLPETLTVPSSSVEVTTSVISIDGHEVGELSECPQEEIVQVLPLEDGTVMDFGDGSETIILETVVEEGIDVEGGVEQEIHYIYVDAEDFVEEQQI